MDPSNNIFNNKTKLRHTAAIKIFYNLECDF